MRVLAYVRQSSQREEETEDTSLSLNTQIAAIEQHATQRGYGPIAKVYADHDLKGYDADRPGLADLLAEVTRGDIVIVYKFSRFARDLVLQELSAQKIEKRGATVESVYEGRDRLIRQIHGAFAEHYSRELSDQLKRALRERKNRGLYQGVTPFGYQRVYRDLNGRNTGFLEPVPEEAPLVQLMFQQFADGVTIHRIADQVTAAGAISRRGTTLRNRAIRDILTNPIYAGGIRDDDTIRWDCHTPIVTRELWESVQPRLAENTTRSRRNGRAAQQPLHLLVRHECGRVAPYVSAITSKRHKNEFEHFRCQNCGKNPDDPRAILERRTISRNATDALIKELLTADLAAFVDPAAMVASAVAALTDPAHEFERKRLAAAIAKLDDRFARLREWYLSGNESVDWLTTQKAEIDTERAALQARLAAMPTAVDTTGLLTAAQSLGSIREVIGAASPDGIASALRVIGHFQFGPSGAQIVYRPPYNLLVPCPRKINWWDRTFAWWRTA